MLESVDFGNNLKKLRLEAGLTQRQLATQIGVSKSILSCYELQSRMPSSEILVKLATIFHVSTDFLLGLDKVTRLEVSDLTEDDIKVVALMIDTLKNKNQKIGHKPVNTKKDCSI